jgi:hypothetical protein
METGGAKGRRREITGGELRARIHRALGVEEASVVNEYGMTEAGSQFYDRTLLDRWLTDTAQGGACDLTGSGATPDAPRLKHGPPWVRAVVCDPETLEPARPGAIGVLRLVDLANRFTLSFLQTADLATCPVEGAAGPGSGPFALLGRAQGAEARGCSLAAEEWAGARAGRPRSRG